MRDYKADITLNEKDSLVDLLTAEKSLLKLYTLVLSESVSKGVRRTLTAHLKAQINDQINTFFLLTELDYLRVQAATKEQRGKVKQEFLDAKNQM